MLRFALMLALLLRLVPAPGMTASHCAPEGSVASAPAGGAHQHHGAPANSEQASSEECSHCPPIECAKHSSCEAPSVVSFLESPLHAASPASIGATLHGAPDIWATTHTAPPTRPPASSLA
jgi:hypothetical protein